MTTTPKAAASRSIVALVDNHSLLSNDNTTSTSEGASGHCCWNGASVVTLKHPRSGDDHHFLLQEPAGKAAAASHHLLEVQSVARPKDYGSFLVGSRVLSNGSLHVATRVDPLFLALGYLSSSQEQQQQQQQRPWEPMDQFLHVLPKPIQQATPLSQWKHLCDTNAEFGGGNDGDDDMVLYRFCESKALAWLAQKQSLTQGALQTQLLHHKQQEQHCKAAATNLLSSTGSGAFHNGFFLDDDEEEKKDDTDSSNKTTTTTTTATSHFDTSVTPRELQQTRDESLQIVCEYLSPAWRTKLLAHVAVKEDVLWSEQERRRIRAAHDDTALTTLKRPRASWEATNPGQNDADDLLQFTMGMGGAASGSTSGASDKHAKVHAQSAGVKRLAKVNKKGMKSLSTFFGVVQKKE